jgi:hypothetical protein
MTRPNLFPFEGMMAAHGDGFSIENDFLGYPSAVKPLSLAQFYIRIPCCADEVWTSVPGKLAASQFEQLPGLEYQLRAICMLTKPDDDFSAV